MTTAKKAKQLILPGFKGFVPRKPRQADKCPACGRPNKPRKGSSRANH